MTKPTHRQLPGPDQASYNRIALENGTAPADAPLIIQPSATPTTLEAGSFWIDASGGPAWSIDGVTSAATGVIAAGKANGSDDTTMLQAKLTAAHAAGGGMVVLVPGQSYVISSPLIIWSNTTFAATGATITLKAGSNCNMLQSQAAYGTGRDSNITIDGGIWDRGANSGTSNGLHTMVLRKVDHVTVRNMTFRSSTNSKFCVLFQNVTDFAAEHIFCDSTNSDGVHVMGPASNGRISHVRGTCGDDMVAIVPLDYAAYVWGDEGDVKDIVIEDIKGVSTSKAIVKVLGGLGLNCTNVAIRDVTGASGNASAVVLGDDPGSANTTGGFIDSISVSGLSVTSATNGSHGVLIVASNGGRFRVSDAEWNSVSGDSQALVRVANSAVIKTLNVANVAVLNGALNVGMVEISGTVDAVSITNVTGTMTVAASLVRLDPSFSTAKARRVSIAGALLTWPSSSGSLVRASVSGQTLDVLMIANAYVSGGPAWIGDLNTTTTVMFNNVSFSNNLFNLGSVGSVTVWAMNADTSGAVVIAGGGVLKSRSLGFRVDVSKLTKAAGDFAYNTNAGLSCGVGPVISDGSFWKHLYTGSTV